MAGIHRGSPDLQLGSSQECIQMDKRVAGGCEDWRPYKCYSRFSVINQSGLHITIAMLFVRSVWCSLQCPCCSGVSRPNHLARPLHDPERAEDTITSRPEPSCEQIVRRPAFHYFYSADLSSPGPDLLRSPLFTLVGVIKLNNANMPSVAVAID